MTAIGFVMFVLFVFLAKVAETAFSNTVENIFVSLYGIGLLLFISGIATWLWRVMP